MKIHHILKRVKCSFSCCNTNQEPEDNVPVCPLGYYKYHGKILNLYDKVVYSESRSNSSKSDE